jgi:hypothetical protein
MGREAVCHYRWATDSGRCKVLLETSELILRPVGKAGSARGVFPIATLKQVETRENSLHLQWGSEAVELTFESEDGASLALSWARKLLTPPPTLAAKLGIRVGSQLKVIGELECDELRAAVRDAASLESRSPELILAYVNCAADLNYVLDSYIAFSEKPPIWIIYAKGMNKSKAIKRIGETEVREMLRRDGFIDTKVASVSATLTGLRFKKL